MRAATEEEPMSAVVYLLAGLAAGLCLLALIVAWLVGWCARTLDEDWT